MVWPSSEAHDCSCLPPYYIIYPALQVSTTRDVGIYLRHHARDSVVVGEITQIDDEILDVVHSGKWLIELRVIALHMQLQ